ncbi:hypothetical protein NQ317_010314 [Molorchus minor]|uniref:Uncharacterized protein n=1 Tax=Molorchus minor TaxID=1323400 RepID=A0ABQ9IZN9_9CUCU|nr:hypothetical protein NQ317_010314 [Molorchus minor]
MTPDQLKFLGSMLPATKPSVPSISKSNIAHTVTSSSLSNKPKPPQMPNSKPGISGPVKQINPDLNKAKQSSFMGKHTLQSSQIFKVVNWQEPAPTKTSPSDDKAAKAFMKDRPNISITPVTGSLPSPTNSASFSRPIVARTSPTNFGRPTLTTSPSSGKTLQEKLAEKKKEQFNKRTTTKEICRSSVVFF